MQKMVNGGQIHLQSEEKKGDFLFFHPLGVLAPSSMGKIELMQSHSLYSHIYNIVVMGGGIAF